MSKKPSCVKADRDVAFFISSLKEGSHLLKIINHGLDVLKENMFVGARYCYNDASRFSNILNYFRPLEGSNCK